MDCGGFVGKYAASALNKSFITVADIDTRLQNLFRMRIRLGHFDPPGPLQEIPASVVCSDESIAVSMYGTFRLNFHRFDRFELDLRGYTPP